jgi:hypothetical protein
MDVWKERMPKNMLLRSSRMSSNIAGPGGELSIDRFEKETHIIVDSHPTKDQFVSYGEWYQHKAVPNLDQTWVKLVEIDPEGFRITLEDGRILKSRVVVVASGITRYPHIPNEFKECPKFLVSHVSDYDNFDQFSGKSVIVIGKGQSALETAALLQECGAPVELLTRGTKLNFIKVPERRGLRGTVTSLSSIHSFLYPPTDLAGPPENWAIADPPLYRSLSVVEKQKLFELIGPIGSGYLESRLAQVPITTQVTVTKVFPNNHQICLELSDGTSRMVDHVLLGTGYRPDVDQVDFLSDELKAAVEKAGSYPRLTLGYESVSVKGLYFLGSLSVESMGPINRFVVGTYPVGQYLTEAVTGSKIGYPTRQTYLQMLGRRVLYRLFQWNNKVRR